MTKFNPENKENPTYGDLLDPAMKITDQADADQYKAEYIKFTQAAIEREGSQGYTAEEVVNRNLGYFAGYYDNETRERVERLFNCAHPVFGSIKENGAPSPEKALAMGLRAGRKAKRDEQAKLHTGTD